MPDEQAGGRKPYSFVAYIDEAGDHGTKLVANASRRGVSEWFVLAAVVVSVANESSVAEWQREALLRLGPTQRRDLHFRAMNKRQRRIVCELLAGKPTRLFVAMSHKRNMQQYMNLRPRYDPDWFYRWMTRVLLERVTHFCQRRGKLDGVEPPTIKLVFSRNGWIDYERTREYFRLLREQSRLGTMHLRVGDLKWDTIDLDQFEAVAHKNNPGVQFADVVASAFFTAVSIANSEGRCDPTFAKLLKSRVFSAQRGQYLGFGLKAMPALNKMGLQFQQRILFEAFGYLPYRW